MGDKFITKIIYDTVNLASHAIDYMNYKISDIVQNKFQYDAGVFGIKCVRVLTENS